MANTPKTPTATTPVGSIAQIIRWFETTTPDPTDRNALMQIGVHFQEVSGMVQTLGGVTANKLDKDQLVFLSDVLNYFQRQLKLGALPLDLSAIHRANLLKALCDQIVTAIGVGYMLGMDIEGALGEVAKSNDSKFDESGKPIFNDQRTMLKGPHYKDPALEQYVSRRENTNA